MPAIIIRRTQIKWCALAKRLKCPPKHHASHVQLVKRIGSRDSGSVRSKAQGYQSRSAASAAHRLAALERGHDGEWGELVTAHGRAGWDAFAACCGEILVRRMRYGVLSRVPAHSPVGPLPLPRSRVQRKGREDRGWTAVDRVRAASSVICIPPR